MAEARSLLCVSPNVNQQVADCRDRVRKYLFSEDSTVAEKDFKINNSTSGILFLPNGPMPNGERIIE